MLGAVLDDLTTAKSSLVHPERERGASLYHPSSIQRETLHPVIPRSSRERDASLCHPSFVQIERRDEDDPLKIKREAVHCSPSVIPSSSPACPLTLSLLHCTSLSLFLSLCLSLSHPLKESPPLCDVTAG